MAELLERTADHRKRRRALCGRMVTPWGHETWTEQGSGGPQPTLQPCPAPVGEDTLVCASIRNAWCSSAGEQHQEGHAVCLEGISGAVSGSCFPAWVSRERAEKGNPSRLVLGSETPTPSLLHSSPAPTVALVGIQRQESFPPGLTLSMVSPTAPGEGARGAEREVT